MDLFVETNLAGETGPTGVTVGEAKKKNDFAGEMDLAGEVRPTGAIAGESDLSEVTGCVAEEGDLAGVSASVAGKTN
jgi:hypothetical protein